MIPHFRMKVGPLLKRWFVLASALIGMHGVASAYQPDYEFQGPAGAFGTVWLPSGLVQLSDPVQVSFIGGGSGFRANLRTGEVGIRVDQQEDLNRAPGYGGGNLLEYVRFSGPAGGGGWFEVSVDLDLHGTTSSRRAGGDTYIGQPNFAFIVNSQIGIHGQVNVGLRGLGAAADATVITFGQQNGNWSQFGPTRFVGTFNVPFNTDIAVNLGIGGNGPFDFLSTGTLHWTLPPGVKVESSSGVFLSPVPELSSGALMLGGMPLLFVAAGFRRHRRFRSRT